MLKVPIGHSKMEHLPEIGLPVAKLITDKLAVWVAKIFKGTIND